MNETNLMQWAIVGTLAALPLFLLWVGKLQDAREASATPDQIIVQAYADAFASIRGDGQ